MTDRSKWSAGDDDGGCLSMIRKEVDGHLCRASGMLYVSPPLKEHSD